MRLQYIHPAAMLTKEFIITLLTIGHRINAVDINKVDLDTEKLYSYNLIEEEQIYFQN